MQAYFCICLMHSKASHISAIGAFFLFESILRIATRQSYYVDAIVGGRGCPRLRLIRQWRSMLRRLDYPCSQVN
jgi:hypothetical protein